MGLKTLLELRIARFVDHLGQCLYETLWLTRNSGVALCGTGHWPAGPRFRLRIVAEAPQGSRNCAPAWSVLNIEPNQET
jgi:hypothetical protein